MPYLEDFENYSWEEMINDKPTENVKIVKSKNTSIENCNIMQKRSNYVLKLNWFEMKLEHKFDKRTNVSMKRIIIFVIESLCKKI